MKDEAAREAVGMLRLLTAAAIPTIVRLLQDDIRDHPRAIAAAHRRDGEQLSDEEKRALGIRRNGFLSRTAFDELTGEGRTHPLVAHELTLLRATFTLIRSLRVADAGLLQARFGSAFLGFEHQTLHRDCPACNLIDGTVVPAAGARILPPAGCVPGCTAS